MYLEADRDRNIEKIVASLNAQSAPRCATS